MRRLRTATYLTTRHWPKRFFILFTQQRESGRLKIQNLNFLSFFSIDTGKKQQDLHITQLGTKHMAPPGGATSGRDLLVAPPGGAMRFVHNCI